MDATPTTPARRRRRSTNTLAALGNPTSKQLLTLRQNGDKLQLTRRLSDGALSAWNGSEGRPATDDQLAWLTAEAQARGLL